MWCWEETRAGLGYRITSADSADRYGKGASGGVNGVMMMMMVFACVDVKVAMVLAKMVVVKKELMIAQVLIVLGSSEQRVTKGGDG